MRNIFRFSLIALLMTAASCEDATDIIQVGELSEENAYRTVDDLQSGLSGVYATYGPDFGTNGDGDLILFNDLFTDNIKRGISSNGQGNEEYNFIINQNTDFANRIWQNRYTVINRANRVLRNIDRIIETSSESDVARANHIRGQLLALRALCHLDLMQYFTVDYQAADSPSIIIMDFVPDLGDVFPRNTVGEVFAFIKADLDAAESNINAGATDTFYLTRDAIMAIRARVLLFEGNPANYATIESITESLLSRHEIITEPQDYQDFWNDVNLESMSEDIFTLFRGQDDNAVAGLFFANETERNGSPFFEMSNQLYETYLTDDLENDYRPEVFLDETSTVTGNRVLIINKYPGANSRGNLINHIKLLRASEMQLIKAEVEARQNKLGEAAASIMELRAARSFDGDAPAVSYGSLNAALQDVLLERRRELCFEGHRFLDLKRIGKELNIGISRDSDDCASFNASDCDLAPSSHLFTMPIPNVETSANNSIEQNPGY